MWECPDFFQINKTHCLLYSTEGNVIWSTGDYDSHTHRYTAKVHGILDHGAYYAPKSFLTPDGRRILWGWIQETRPQAEYAAAGWAGAMALPRMLRVGQQGQLEINPALEVEKLRGPAEHKTLDLNTPYRLKLTTLRHEFLASTGLAAGSFTVRLLTGNQPVWELTIDVTSNVARCGDISFALPSPPWPKLALRLFLDGSVIESFIGGREALTSRVYALQPGGTDLEITVAGANSVTVSHWLLNAISPNRLTT